jgi:hypothetical protein
MRESEVMKSFWGKAKWFILATIAAVATILAALYGKRTPQVLRSKLREVRAREGMLALELKATEAEAQKRNGSVEAKRFIDRADTISKKLEVIRETRNKVLSETGDLEKMSDDDVALRDNARARARSRS